MPPNPCDPSADRPFFGRAEALRGLGALAVAGYHFSSSGSHGFTFLQHGQWPSAAPAQYALARLGLFLLPGHAFLMLFFVLSGFVLRVSLEHGPRSGPAAAAKFLISRLFRFYPIVAVAVIVAAVMAPAEVAHDAAPARRLAANLLLLDVSLNSHLWALQVELLMVPVILALFFLERRWGPYAVAGVALAATGLVFVSRWAVWPPLSVNLFAFVLGMGIPTLGRRFAAGLSARAAAGWAAGLAVVLLLTGPCLGVYSRVGSILEAYGAAAVLSVAAYRGDAPGLRWLDARWLRRLGSAAGSYYVLHMATVPAAVAVAAALIPAAWSTRAPGAVGLGVIAVWLLVIAPPLVCVSRLVEVPGIAVGRRLIRALGLDVRPTSRPAGAAVPARQAA
jgi:peptidoglycan/LPS O-acetylase OafA/YrhL